MLGEERLRSVRGGLVGAQMDVLATSHLSDEGLLFDKVNFLLAISPDAEETRQLRSTHPLSLSSTLSHL